MNINFLKPATCCLIGGAALLSGCSSTDSSTTTPALTITSENATDTVAAAISSTSSGLSDVPVGAEATQAPTAMDILHLAEDLVDNANATSLLSTPTGITRVILCNSGSFSNSYDFTATSRAGSITFDGCRFAGVTLAGTLSYSLDWTEPAGPYTYQFSGDVSAELLGAVTEIGSLNYTVSGDETTGEYAVDPFNHSVEFSGGRGVSVSLLDPITGDLDTDDRCPLTGTVLVAGANGTQARATIVSPGDSGAVSDVTIEYNDGSGEFTLVETVPCTDIFPVGRPYILRFQND